MTTEEVNSEGWDRVRRILERALELPEGERDAFIDSASDGDPELAAEVRTYIMAAGGDGLLDRSLDDVIDRVVSNGSDLAAARRSAGSFPTSPTSATPSATGRARSSGPSSRSGTGSWVFSVKVEWVPCTARNRPSRFDAKWP